MSDYSLSMLGEYEKALKLMPKAIPVRYSNLGHFDIYFDDGFKSSIRDQISFLKKYVLK